MMAWAGGLRWLILGCSNCWNCVQFEEAAREVADEVTRPRPEGEEDVHDIQVTISSAAHPVNVRSLKVEVFDLSSYFSEVIDVTTPQYSHFTHNGCLWSDVPSVL